MTDLLGIKERGERRRAACQSGRLCYYSLRVGWKHSKEAEEVVRDGGAEGVGGLYQTGRGLAV